MPSNALTCPPGSYPVTTPDGIDACAFKPYPCQLPQVAVCGSTFESCSCRTPASAMACEVRIQYAQGDPTSPVLMPMAPYCDGAGAELALAIILARVLGAKP